MPKEALSTGSRRPWNTDPDPKHDPKGPKYFIYIFFDFKNFIISRVFRWTLKINAVPDPQHSVLIFSCFEFKPINQLIITCFLFLQGEQYRTRPAAAQSGLVLSGLCDSRAILKVSNLVFWILFFYWVFKKRWRTYVVRCLCRLIDGLWNQWYIDWLLHHCVIGWIVPRRICISW